jgi:cobyric acid synthase CobQ/L-threonine-O-3-phosphate decarboxylase
VLERYGHGGDLTTAAALFGKPEGGFLDFSSNMNPFGPPEAVGRLLAEKWRELARYPDPASRGLIRAIARACGVPEECVVAGNGAAELIDLAVRVRAPRAAGIVRPSFSEYEEAVRKAGGDIVDILLRKEDGFALREETVRQAAERTDLLIIGHPNNPTGRLADPELLKRLARSGKRIIVDEAFIDFVPDEEAVSLIRLAAETEGLAVIRSLTKFYAIPGARLGFMVASPEFIRAVRMLQVPWSVNAAAQWIGEAVLEEREYAERTRRWLADERPWLAARLESVGLTVYPSDANFLLVSIPSAYGADAKQLQQAMGEKGVLIRDASLFPGLDPSYFRLAVRTRAENEAMLECLVASLEAIKSEAASGGRRRTPEPASADNGEKRSDAANLSNEADPSAASPANEMRTADADTASPAANPAPGANQGSEQMARTASRIQALEQAEERLAPTIMLQGTSSDVGKSVMAAALCRIFTQDGLKTAPFKSQNMSLNSYVTPDGKEIGRAQGMQADACRIPASTDMNPILLKPSKDMVAQVVVHGKPLRDYDARAYRETYLPTAESIVREALGRLRRRYDVVVIEGAGSPAEVNLKDRDIVNMRLAGWADAPVILVADIDKGGVFASIVGTMEILTPEERERVKGFIINKFRGDVSLLKPGLDWLEQRTGKPVLGVIPYLREIGLEDEDSASLDDKTRHQSAGSRSGPGQVDIAVIRLPRISNFTDFDPLFEEKDAHVRYISRPEDWGEPDAVIIPGSKNTIEDLRFLRESGFEPLILRHAAQGGRLVGICAGYQMLGRRLMDPQRIESDTEMMDGLGFFPSQTVFTPDKRTERVLGTARWPDGTESFVEGYEIHMGRTEFLEPAVQPFSIRIHDDPDEPPYYHLDGAVTPDGKVWGTYMHGIFHNDKLRRQWLNAVRADKGWLPLEEELVYNSKREEAFDRLAAHVRAHLDMGAIYAMIGRK